MDYRREFENRGTGDQLPLHSEEQFKNKPCASGGGESKNPVEGPSCTERAVETNQGLEQPGTSEGSPKPDTPQGATPKPYRVQWNSSVPPQVLRQEPFPLNLRRWTVHPLPSPKPKGEIGHLFVTNLDSSVRDPDLRHIFETYGTLMDAAVHYKKNGDSLGTADVLYEKYEDAVNAKKHLSGKVHAGESMHIEIIPNDFLLE